MSRLKKFWHALDALPTLAAVEAEWLAHVYGEINLIKPFLRPAKDRATSYPNLNGGLPYTVVEHGPNDIVGVCPETGDTIPLNRQQLVVYRLDQNGLARKVASALGLSSTVGNDTHGDRLSRLGSVRPSGNTLPAFLILPRDSSDIATLSASLISQGLSPFLLLTPTRRFVTAEVEMRLRSIRSGLLALADTLVVADDGRWIIDEEAIRSALPDRPAEAEPLSERAQDVLIAMLQLVAVDSDSRKPTAEIAARALGSEADANALKSVMSDLATRQLIDTQTGRGGGCWLTAEGQRRAQKLSQS